MTRLADQEAAGAPLPRHDWSARARSTALDALRYTKFVGVAKRALQVAAFAVIAAVLAFFFFQRQPARVTMGFERLGHLENDLAMVKPRLSGQDGEGNPFVITADAAIQDAHNPKKATLKKIEADLAIDKQSWIDARAAAGMIDMTAHKLALSGGIDLFTDTGYQLHTQTAFADLKTNVMTGPSEVTGMGPMGTLRADRFTATRDSGQILLQGNVRMTIDKDKK